MKITALLLILALGACQTTGPRTAGEKRGQALAETVAGFGCSMMTGGLCALPLVFFSLANMEDDPPLPPKMAGWYLTKEAGQDL